MACLPYTHVRVRRHSSSPDLKSQANASGSNTTNSIIVEGPPAWAEDGWQRIAIGEYELRVVKPCSRCKVPNIDQETGAMDMAVTAALKSFRCVNLPCN